ncbi:MAG: heme biosynthesis protein HemY [Rhizobiaceae bacterium]
MVRILFFLAVVFALGLGFAWLADRPGDLVVTFGGYRYEVSLMVAAVAVTAIVSSIMIAWWLVKAIWNSPYLITRYFRVRRRDRGYQSLSTGLIAAGAGDAAAARRHNKQAAKMISADQEPLIHLLDAQTMLLEGDHDGARRKFEAMVEDPETRLLGLRGLYLEAARLGDRQVARHYAGRAAEIAPQLGWAADATIEEKTGHGDWDGAIALVEAQRAAGHMEKASANRRKAVLLTAKARDLLDSDPLAARNAGVEANRLAPDLVPAAVVAAKALFRQNDVRKGSKILEAAWKLLPHPEIAEAYVHARPGDATLDRLSRARRLETLRTNHPESSLAVARAAFDAGEFAESRAAAEAALRMESREAGYLMLADIEEAETGDQGMVRQWLGRAVRAPRDPAWVADGHVSERWEPVSPVTGRLDAFEWKAPIERAAPMIEESDGDPSVPMIASQASTPQAVEPPVVEEASTPATTPVESEPDVAAAQPTPARPAKAAPPRIAVVPHGDSRPTHPPDDPGVDPDDDRSAEARRFKLF